MVPTVTTLRTEVPAAPRDAKMTPAGNVMGFLHPDTRRPVLAQLAGWLTADGRAVIGFGAGRGYAFADFFADAAASGLDLQQAYSTWDLRPYAEGAGFLVAVFGRA